MSDYIGRPNIGDFDYRKKLGKKLEKIEKEVGIRTSSPPDDNSNCTRYY